MTAADGPVSSRARWWRQGATLLSVAGLLVALVFNTAGVWQSAAHQKQARDTQQISLLTQLNSNATDTEKAINATHAPRRCQPDGPLSFKDEALLVAALDYYEYLAWLFNHGRLTVELSRQFFGPRMIDGIRLARRYLGSDRVAHDYVELSRFLRETRPSELPDDLCEQMRRDTVGPGR